MATTTEQKLQSIVAQRLQIAPEAVSLDQEIVDELGLDSFDLVGLILEIEEAFAPVKISDESAAEFRTLREVGRYIDHFLSNSESINHPS